MGGFMILKGSLEMRALDSFMEVGSSKWLCVQRWSLTTSYLASRDCTSIMQLAARSILP